MPKPTALLCGMAQNLRSRKLLVRAPAKVVCRKVYGWRESSLAGSFVFIQSTIKSYQNE